VRIKKGPAEDGEYAIRVVPRYPALGDQNKFVHLAVYAPDGSEIWRSSGFAYTVFGLKLFNMHDAKRAIKRHRHPKTKPQAPNVPTHRGKPLPEWRA
jgi:hypothetical protein